MRSVVSYDDITLPYETTSAIIQETSKMTSAGTSNSATTPSTKSSSKKRVPWPRQRLEKRTCAQVPFMVQYPAASCKEAKEIQHAVNGNTEEETPQDFDSKPIDFHTFVPAHDATLSAAPQIVESSGPDPLSQYASPGQVTSQAETFQRGMESSFSSGYWTGVFHMKGTGAAHDAALAAAPPLAGGTPAPPHYTVSLSPGQMVSQADAFQRGMDSSFWSGYWTAVFHYQGQLKGTGTVSRSADINHGGDGDGEVQVEAEPELEPEHAEVQVEDENETLEETRAILDIGDGRDEDEDEDADHELDEDEDHEDGGVPSGPNTDLVSTQR
ncbi:hypothetical protein BDP27DRAFT_1448345 [Rhodocollybia butyracea]|uniref:Uncharacterized protein n=1 Tax=Rhodocollybia butyracea TaxID=206335 RepID=A0A9P5PS94_9AGAR|nr:hypothetical protein BDP27DRAFT_1448345 [Rhodocollybia butyracea]